MQIFSVVIHMLSGYTHILLSHNMGLCHNAKVREPNSRVRRGILGARDMCWREMTSWLLQHIDDFSHLEQFDPVQIQLDENEAVIWEEHLLKILADFSQERLLDATLDPAGEVGVVVDVELGGDDGRADVLAGVDDLLDAGHAEGDMWRSKVKEMCQFDKWLIKLWSTVQSNVLQFFTLLITFYCYTRHLMLWRVVFHFLKKIFHI